MVTLAVARGVRAVNGRRVPGPFAGYRELILNYFHAQKLLSSGLVEGLNNKAKVTIRRSYGFRTFHALELALYHTLGKLPEAESTRKFF
jgi:transposase